MVPNLAFTWQLTEVHGWGLVGVHTALYLADQGRPPLLLEKPLMGTLRPENRAKLQSLEGPYQQVAAMAELLERLSGRERALALAAFDGERVAVRLEATNSPFATGESRPMGVGLREAYRAALDGSQLTLAFPE